VGDCRTIPVSEELVVARRRETGGEGGVGGDVGDTCKPGLKRLVPGADADPAAVASARGIFLASLQVGGQGGTV